VYEPFQAGDCKIEIIDTVGLHESARGTVPADQAVVELVELLENARDGFSLLVHVTRASRITKEHDDDYKFFVEKMTQGKIPVMLAVTGCENEHLMNAWVQRNQEAFSRFSYKELVPTCLASGGPMEEFFSPLRTESRDQLLRSIIESGSRYFCESFYGHPYPTSGKNYATANAFGGPSRPAYRVRGGRSLRLPTEPCVRVRTRLLT
jgi:hypothetical protein